MLSKNTQTKERVDSSIPTEKIGNPPSCPNVTLTVHCPYFAFHACNCSSCLCLLSGSSKMSAAHPTNFASSSMVSSSSLDKPCLLHLSGCVSIRLTLTARFMSPGVLCGEIFKMAKISSGAGSCGFQAAGGGGWGDGGALCSFAGVLKKFWHFRSNYSYARADSFCWPFRCRCSCKSSCSCRIYSSLLLFPPFLMLLSEAFSYTLVQQGLRCRCSRPLALVLCNSSYSF